MDIIKDLCVVLSRTRKKIDLHKYAQKIFQESTAAYVLNKSTRRVTKNCLLGMNYYAL